MNCWGRWLAGLPLEGVVILPPLPYLGAGRDFGATPARRTSSSEKGAYTGEVCAAMLVEVGALMAWSAIPSAASTTMRAASWSHASSPPPTPAWCRCRAGETLNSARPGRPSGHRQPAGTGAGAGRRGRFRQCCGRLRAGLGHRYRPYRQQGTGTAGARSSVAKSRASMLESLIHCPLFTAVA